MNIYIGVLKIVTNLKIKMKTRSIKIILVCILTATLAINGFSQTTDKCDQQCCKNVVRLKKEKVPKQVTENYDIEYTEPSNVSWQGYSEFNNEDDWYGYNDGLFTEDNPEYYIVEFTKDKTPQKVIYSKTGEKISTHKNLNSDLPQAVSLAISKGEYATWNLGTHKEEIFKDAEKDALRVYKVDVEKGEQKHILFYSVNGVLLKDKTMQP